MARGGDSIATFHENVEVDVREAVFRFIVDMPLDGYESYNELSKYILALVASGTATLEAAIMGTPMCVVYKVSFLNWLIARQLITVPHIGLVNVVAGEKIVPEFIQYQARPASIAAGALGLLQNPDGLADVKRKLNKVRESLGEPGASEKAAEIVLQKVS